MTIIAKSILKLVAKSPHLPALNYTLQLLQYKKIIYIGYHKITGHKRMLPDKSSFVTINSDGKLDISVQSLAEAKIAIKELKQKKKEYALRKREISQQQKTIRAEYTDKVCQRGSKVRGSSIMGRLARTLQTSKSDADRRALAQQLAPLEQQKNAVDEKINAIDQAILQIERYNIENS